jgi:cytochrome c2
MSGIWPRVAAIIFAGVVLAAGGGGYLAYEQASAERERVMRMTGGDPLRAPAYLRRYGCTGCHQVPGIRAPGGRVGPSLAGVGGRLYIAGRLPNTPGNMVAWIVDPPAFSPRTAMPVTGITETEARDVAAYLYTK